MDSTVSTLFSDEADAALVPITVATLVGFVVVVLELLADDDSTLSSDVSTAIVWPVL